MELSDQGYWAAFLRMQHMNAQKLKKIVSFFGSPEVAWRTGTHSLFREAGITERSTERIIIDRKGISPEREYNLLVQQGIGGIAYTDAHYPDLLRQCMDAPAFLFYRGAIALMREPLIAVVGSRKMTAYGKQVVGALVPALVRAGLGIVSGFALGIDSEAHVSCIHAYGKTIGVLPGGIDSGSIYPRMHEPLVDQVLAAGGLLVSEFPPQTESFAHLFPFRNRIIAGMCRGTVVIEAAEGSGTRLTAEYALEYGREVFAVSHPIFSPTGIVPHQLIKNGAVPVRTVDDILEAFHMFQRSGGKKEQDQLKDLSELERKIVDLLGGEPRGGDEILLALGLDTQKVLSTLSIMELKRIVQRTNGFYRLV